MAEAGGSPPGSPPIRILNAANTPENKKKSATELAEELRKLMLRLKGAYMTDDGARVKYDELRNSELFKQFKNSAQDLNNVELKASSENERKAFFINIYNVLTIHGLVDLDTLPDSVLSVQLFWRTTAYNIGALVYTLDDIEHGILRGNRPHPSSTRSPFKPDDPRCPFIMKTLDPRIHFVLNCGAKSCPAISVYKAETLEADMDTATKNFCDQEVICLPKCQEIILSKIFQWYRNDFGGDDVKSMRWTVPYLSEKKQLEIQNLLYKLEQLGGVDVLYNEYDWSLNH